MKLLNFGSCNIDYVYKLDHIVTVGETESSMGMQVFPGGKGLNQSVAVSRAGSKVYHAGKVGEDGQILVKLLRDSGVNVDFLKTAEEKSGHAIIQVSSLGENSIFIYSGANACVNEEYINFVLSNFTKGDLLLLQNEISNVDYIVSRACEKQMIVILNPSPMNEAIGKVDLTKISYLILNQTEAKAITGRKDEAEALRYFKHSYPELKVVLTLGKNGSVYQDKKQTVFQNSYKVDAVDTTAAGDTFTGYFISGLMKGFSLQKSMRLASCASAVCVSKNGAAPSIPLFEEVEGALESMKLNNAGPKEHEKKRIIEREIEQNLATITLQDLSVRLGYSPVYTGAIIKKYFGSSFKKLLLEKKLDKASELLRDSKLSVGEIIKTLGYENEGYFRKKFLEKYGKKPLEYRNMEVNYEPRDKN